MLIDLPYDAASAVKYARKWAMARNQQYYDFEDIGGDCTNFASQCLYAGTGVMNWTPVTGWYYVNLSDRTASWTGVEYLYDFLVNNEGAGPRAVEVSRREVRPGDIVQLGGSDGHFYHSPVIVAVEPRILVCAHTLDALDRPLDTYVFSEARFLHIEGARKWVQ